MGKWSRKEWGETTSDTETMVKVIVHFGAGEGVVILFMEIINVNTIITILPELQYK